MPNYIDLFAQNYTVSQMGALSINPMNYVTNPMTLNIDQNGAAEFINVLEQATGIDLSGTNSDATMAWNAWLAAFDATASTDINDFINWLTNIGAETTVAINQILAYLQQSWLTIQNIFNSVVGGFDSDVNDFITALNDSITNSSNAWTAWETFFTDIGFSVTNAAEFATFITGVANAGPWPGVTNATAIANAAIYKPSYLAIDATGDAVFPVSLLTSSGMSVPVTPAQSVIGYIGTPDAGLKESIIWLAPTVGSGLTLYFGIYQVNTSTGALTRMMAAIGPVTTAASGWNYTTIPTPFVSVQGAWYAIELMMEGAPGTSFNVNGILNHGVPVNTITTGFPQSMGASRASITQVNFNTAGAGATGTGASPFTKTESHTAALGSDVLVFAGAYSGATITALTASYNGVSMGAPVVSTNPNATASDGLFSLFRAAGAGTGSAATVSVTATSTATIFLTLNSVSYPNVSSLTGTLTATGQSTTPLVTNSGIPGAIVVVSFMSLDAFAASTISSPTGFTQRSLINSFATNYPAIIIGDTTTAGSLSMSVTTPSTAWAAITVQLQGTPALPPSTIVAPGPTYSNDVPWFGLGGGLGIPQQAPYQQTYTTSTFTFTIPSWMIIGDLIDIVLVSDGGGGAPGSTIFAYGDGGFPGNWSAVSLVYGVDIPLTTHTITGTIGQGGAGGIIEINSGIPGTGCTVTITGYAGSPITVAGGAAGGVFGISYIGQSPGNYTFSSGLGNTTYTGGGAQFISSSPGVAPGGGGSGGQYLTNGAAGAHGQVWITAYQ